MDMAILPCVNGNSSNNNWSGLKRIVDSNPEGKDKLHDLKLRGGEMLNDILHNNKNKNNFSCLRRRLLSYFVSKNSNPLKVTYPNS
jgi:hypothetical protein